MQTTISRWGNSLGVRLPKPLVEAVRLVEGATVTLAVEDGSIKVTPTRKRFKLSELLTGECVAREFDWGSPTGKEEW